MLPTVDDCKSYLRIQTNAEDALVAQLLARAQLLIEGLLGYALTAVSRPHVNYEEVDNHGQRPAITLPGPFKTAVPAPIVTDVDGTVVDATTYTLDVRGMRILAKPGVLFPRRPYSVVADIGLSAHPDYAAKLEGEISNAIIDQVAHLYFNRNPAISSESDEAGAVKVLSDGGQQLIPGRVYDAVNLMPGRNAGIILA